MDYLSIFDISASGMNVEKARMEAISLNLANANSTRASDGTLYKPLRVITAQKSIQFEQAMVNIEQRASLNGVEIVDVQPMNIEPRLVYEPGHPAADKNGYVEYANVNTVTEMVKMMEATRSYEANVRAMNAAKSMALRALEIGK